MAVTGATGLLGRHLCDHFRRRGWEVRALARNTSAYPFTEESITRFRCSLPEDIDTTALQGAKVLIHCAYLTKFTNLAEAQEVNEKGTRRILELSRRANIKRFVFVSSMSAHEGARSYYGRSKYVLEQIMDPGRDLVLRPGLILADGGLFSRMVDSMKKVHMVPVFRGGRQIVQTVHIEDLCQAFHLALDGDITGALTIAEPKGLTMKELLKLMAAHLRLRCVMVPMPYTPVFCAARLFEAIGIQLPITSENLLGLRELRHVSTEPHLKRLGLTVRTAQESLVSLL